MSNRLTPKWTPTAEGAFGQTGARGRAGEKFVLWKLQSQNFECIDDGHDVAKQIAGIDIEVNGITMDVKANLRNDGIFYIETDATGWLFSPNKTSDIIIHVNPQLDKCVWYFREVIQRLVVPDRGLVKIQTVHPTMSQSWHELYEVIRNE